MADKGAAGGGEEEGRDVRSSPAAVPFQKWHRNQVFNLFLEAFPIFMVCSITEICVCVFQRDSNEKSKFKNFDLCIFFN